MGWFSKDDGKANPMMSMMMSLLSNPKGVKSAIISKAYPLLESALVKHIEQTILEEGEAYAAIVLVANGRGGLTYALCTFSEGDGLMRQVEVEDLKEKLEKIIENTEL